MALSRRPSSKDLLALANKASERKKFEEEEERQLLQAAEEAKAQEEEDARRHAGLSRRIADLRKEEEAKESDIADCGNACSSTIKACNADAQARQDVLQARINDLQAEIAQVEASRSSTIEEAESARDIAIKEHHAAANILHTEITKAQAELESYELLQRESADEAHDDGQQQSNSHETLVSTSTATHTPEDVPDGSPKDDSQDEPSDDVSGSHTSQHPSEVGLGDEDEPEGHDRSSDETAPEDSPVSQEPASFANDNRPAAPDQSDDDDNDPVRPLQRARRPRRESSNTHNQLSQSASGPQAETPQQPPKHASDSASKMHESGQTRNFMSKDKVFAMTNCDSIVGIEQEENMFSDDYPTIVFIKGDCMTGLFKGVKGLLGHIGTKHGLLDRNEILHKCKKVKVSKKDIELMRNRSPPSFHPIVATFGDIELRHKRVIELDNDESEDESENEDDLEETNDAGDDSDGRANSNDDFISGPVAPTNGDVSCRLPHQQQPPAIAPPMDSRDARQAHPSSGPVDDNKFLKLLKSIPVGQSHSTPRRTATEVSSSGTQLHPDGVSADTNHQVGGGEEQHDLRKPTEDGSQKLTLNQRQKARDVDMASSTAAAHEKAHETPQNGPLNHIVLRDVIAKPASDHTSAASQLLLAPEAQQKSFERPPSCAPDQVTPGIFSGRSKRPAQDTTLSEHNLRNTQTLLSTSASNAKSGKQQTSDPLESQVLDTNKGSRENHVEPCLSTVSHRAGAVTGLSDDAGSSLQEAHSDTMGMDERPPNTSILHGRHPNTRYSDRAWYFIRCKMCHANSYSLHGSPLIYFHGLQGLQRHVRQDHDLPAQWEELGSWSEQRLIKHDDFRRINQSGLPPLSPELPYGGNGNGFQNGRRSHPPNRMSRVQAGDRIAYPGDPRLKGRGGRSELKLDTNIPAVQSARSAIARLEGPTREASDRPPNAAREAREMVFGRPIESKATPGPPSGCFIRAAGTQVHTSSLIPRERARSSPPTANLQSVPGDQRNASRSPPRKKQKHGESD